MSERSGNNPIRTLVIVGGGTAGWMAAAMLAAQLPPAVCRIELVECESIGIIGVGESTIPPFVRLLQKLGIDERDFLLATQGCYKLGIRFSHWRAKGQHYFHPFGAIGQRIGNHDFYQCWLKARQRGDVPPLLAFSPCAALAESGRFYRACVGGQMGASYALHMDAARAVDYLREYACARGVVRTEGKVISARRKNNGHLSTLTLEHGQKVEGDFFVDCTGFAARLIQGELGATFEDWSDLMPCDRSVTVKTASVGPLKPYTEAIARKAGWSWRIPLRESTGHGYVYSSRHCSDAEAKSTLLRHLDGPRISEPRAIPFRTGRRREIWKDNCLALGLSAGFVEPLESTSIHLIARGVEFFLRYFPDADCEPALRREYNRRMAADFEEVRDFILLHYSTSERRDSDFWRHCAEQSLPESLLERIELFRAQGAVREGVDDLFRASSWQAVFEGMGIRPAKYNSRVDSLSTAALTENLNQTRAAVQSLVRSMPTLDEYLATL